MKHGSNGFGYSAQVRLRLECGGQAVPLSHVAPDWIMPAQPRDLPPGPGEIVTVVDGQEHRRSVFLDQGMSHTSVRVAVRPHVAA